MADSNQLKRVDPVELNDDDPFAELTKIMGFDPRVPVRPASEQEAAQAAATPASDPDFDLSVDDLGIDLEKELLGELALEDEVDAPADRTREMTFQPQLVVQEVDLDPNLDVAIAADLYGSFAQQNSPATSLDTSLEHEPLLSDVDFDAAFERELAVGHYAAPEQAEVVDERVTQDSLAPEDAALLAALDLPDDVDAPVASRFVAADDVEPQHSYAAEDPDFDLAMAEVDMDFSADVEVAEHAVAGYGAPAVSQWDSPVSYEQGTIDFADAEEPTFEETEALQAESVEPQLTFAQQADVEQSVQAVAPSEPEAEELSLEDELNALLGNSVPRAQLMGGYDAPPLTAALAHPEEPSSSYYAQAGGAFDDRVRGQDYADDVVDDYAGPSYRVADVAHDAQADEGAALYVEQAQSEVEDLEFDDHAFHAAFENSLGSEDFPVNATRSSDFDYYQPQANSAAYAGTAAFSEVPAWSSSNSANETDVPDIETIDVPESAVAVADDLDIPEVAYEEEVRAAAVFDDFEAEFAAVYAEPQPVEEAVSRPTPHVESSYDDGHLQAQSAQFDYASGAAAAAIGAGAAYASASRVPSQPHFDAVQGFDVDNLPSSLKPTTGNADPFALMDYDDGDEEAAILPYAEPRRAPRRRGLVVAAVAGGVAVLGGLGVFALSFGGGEAGAPSIVKADETPIKVRPENPGGATVPNQDNKVYQTVAGGGAPAPKQEKLISSAEQPVDMAAKAPEPEFAPPAGVDDEEGFDAGDEIAAIAGKAEDRVQPSAISEQPETDNTEVAAVTPRRVRTMVVRPDGTLVPREDPAPAASQEPQAAASAIMEASVNAPADANAARAVSATAPNSGNANSVTPASVPVAPPRPADQPVNVVGEIKPQQVAAVDTTAPAAAGGWSMQIASQPSEDAAKSTYQDLARRYGGVLSGRDVAIVKAEVAGKGTFWRVRVPAGSRNDAISLCESYKAAGGSCFVSK